jgi:hypothetical protein
MTKFRDVEKAQLEKFKQVSASISDAGHNPGLYKKKPRQFCLPVESAVENLYPDIRETAVAFFKKHKIKWHDGQAGCPSHHMCDSQVSCVNFLFSFGDQPEVLANLLKPVYPELNRMLHIEDGRYVTFEWIGLKDYLGEKRESRNKVRSRGANCTSADAAVMFEKQNGSKQLVLIEWKYTESYSSYSKATAKGGETRLKTYRELFNSGFVINHEELKVSYESLFIEPFYQFMRQQFLAYEMEQSRELGADIVSVLHIAPIANKDFRKVTSKELVGLGESATHVWGKLVNSQSKFKSIFTEELFGTLIHRPPEPMAGWAAYIRSRYLWMSEGPVELA